MSRIADRFAQCAARGEGTLVTYLMGGDPDLERGLAALRAVAAGGADVIELGVPFSDPMADGRVIELAAIRALGAGTHLPDLFAMVREFRKDYNTPVLFMTYWNPILQYGPQRACEDAKAAGVDGFLISDLPPEEAGEWLAVARPAGIDTIFLLAPTSPESRIRLVAREGSGFVYCVSRLGVTGARAALPPELPALVAKIKSLTDQPVAVGFGISTPDQIHEVCQIADGAIVGSVLVKTIADHADGDLAGAVKAFVRSLKEATMNIKPGG
ncbi:MAG: tryptophan synthase subunit alpha [Armatimonadota bacterium]